MKRLITLATLAALAFAGEAAAQVRLLGITNPRNPTVYSVVKDFGCHPDWFSKAMSDSGIESLRPRLGTRVIIKTPRCAPAPPESVARRSRELLGQGATQRRVLAEAASSKPAVETFESEKRELQQKLSSAEAASRELREKLTLAEKDYHKEIATLRANPAGEKHSAGALVVGALGLLALGGIAAFLFSTLRADNSVCYQSVWKVRDGNQTRFFRFIGTGVNATPGKKPVGLYQCSCGDTVDGRTQALQDHLKNKCTVGKVTSNASAPAVL